MEGRGRPYGVPAHCMRDADFAAEGARGVCGGFHAPSNDHNRIMSSAGAIERHFLRTFERPPEFSTFRPGLRPPSACGSRSTALHRAAKQQQGLGTGGATAPGCALREDAAAGGAEAFEAATVAVGAATTQFGAPCFTVPAVVAADLVTGRPARRRAQQQAAVEEGEEGQRQHHEDGAETGPAGDDAAGRRAAEPPVDAWRTARVKAYAVPVARHGYGEGGLRAPHQDYRWYKFYGFAGRGAATAWGCNPGKVPTALDGGRFS